MGNGVRLKEFYDLKPKRGEIALLFLRYSGILLETGGKVLLFDPEKSLSGVELELKKLKLVFYTHPHSDHYVEDSAREIFEATDATFVAERNVYNSLRDFLPQDRRVMAQAGEMVVGDLKVEAVEGHHPGHILLYLVSVNDVKLFHGADSGYVSLPFKADMAMVPTGTPSPTASPEDAFKMVLSLSPKIVVAMHGTSSQHRALGGMIADRLPGVQFIAPDPNKPVKLEIP